jgi:PAS domain S-box-containing protein
LDRILGVVAAGGRVDHFETERVCKDGGIVDVSITVSPIRNRDGHITGASAVARDVTERKRAIDALAGS